MSEPVDSSKNEAPRERERERVTRTREKESGNPLLELIKKV